MTKQNIRNRKINNRSRKDQLPYLDLLYNDYQTDYPVNKYGLGSAIKGAFKDAFSADGLKAIAGAGIGSLGSVVGNIGGGLISGGKSSGVGNAIGNIGGTIGGAIGAVNPVAGAIVGAASGVLGGITNTMFGSKLNEERIAQAENEINAVKSFNADASNFDDLSQQIASQPVIAGFSQSDIGSDGWFSNKAKNKYKDLLAQKQFAEAWQRNSILNNAENLQENQLGNLLQNYAAYGGGIHIKPENRGKFTALKERTGKSATWFKEHGTPAQKKMAIFALNSRKWEHKDGGLLNDYSNYINDTYNPNMEKVSKLFAGGGNLEGNREANTPLGAIVPKEYQNAADLAYAGLEFTPYVGSALGVIDVGNDLYNMYKNRDISLRSVGNLLFDSMGLIPGVKTLSKASDIARALKAEKKADKLAKASNKLNSVSKQGIQQSREGVQKAKKWVKETDKQATNAALSRNKDEMYKSIVNSRESNKFTQGILDAVEQSLNPKWALYNEVQKGGKFANSANDALGLTMGLSDNSILNKKAFGGDLLSNGVEWDNGVTVIGNGGTHEESPYEGVQMGVDPQGIPNLVEEGEVIWNDYVFSNRIPVPNAVRSKYKLRGAKDMTFADAAKKVSKESEEMPNDNITQRGLQDIMSKLAYEQEAIREKRNMKRQNRQYAKGGILGNKGNLFFTGGPYEYGQNPLNMENYSDLSSLYKQGSDYMNKRQYIIDNWDSDYVKNWIKNTYVPYVQNYNKSRGYKSDFTVNLDQFTKGTYDNQYGGMHKGVLNFTIPEKSNNQQEVPAMNIYTTRGRRGGDISINPEALDLYGYSIPQDIIETTREWGNTVNYLQNLQNSTSSKLKINTGSKKKGNKDGSDETILGGDNLLRYAPVVGSAIGLGQTLLSKPNYSRADALAQFAQNAGKVTPISYDPLGNYLTYRPIDIDYIANRMAAQAGATRRNIMNTAGGNRAMALAGLAAQDYSSQLAQAEAIRQADESNFNRGVQVETFNRGTNQYNSEAALKAAMANQEARLKASQLGLSGYSTAMQMKDAIDAQRNASISANLTNLFDSLGDIGREEVVKGMVKNNPALLYDYFGRYKGNVGAKGGKLNRKKRGGFTY